MATYEVFEGDVLEPLEIYCLENDFKPLPKSMWKVVYDHLHMMLNQEWEEKRICYPSVKDHYTEFLLLEIVNDTNNRYTPRSMCEGLINTICLLLYMYVCLFEDDKDMQEEFAGERCMGCGKRSTGRYCNSSCMKKAMGF